MAVNQAALEVDHLSIAIGERVLVEDFSLSLDYGESLGLYGASGTGKTTFARAVAGLLDPSGAITCSGSIRVAGSDVLPGDETAGVPDAVLLPQNALLSMPPLIKAGDLAEALLGGSSDTSTRLQLQEVLTRLGVKVPERALLARPSELSGGERQRFLLALALLKDPKILIADEPTSALDQASRDLVVRALKAAQEATNFALIVISHDRSLLTEVCVRSIPLAGRRSRAGQRKGRDRRYSVKRTGSLTSRRDPAPHEADRGLLVAKDVTVQHGKRVVLDRMSVSLRTGARLGVIGPSGSGKTTLVKALAGLLRPTSGAVLERLSGGDWSRLRRPDRRIQFLYQDPAAAFDPRLTLFQSIALAANRTLRHRERSRPRILDLAKRLRIEIAALDRRPGRVSGGECQRAALLRALLCEPTILIADEPTSSLDEESALAVRQILSELVQETELSLILVSHDLEFVRATCEMVVELSGDSGPT